MSAESPLPWTDGVAVANYREAKLNRYPSGEPIGVAMFLTADELHDIGANLDTDRLAYAVVNGQLRVGSNPGRETDSGEPK